MEEITNFSEQLVIRDPQPIDLIKKVMIIVGTIAVSFGLFLIGLVFTSWLFIFWMLGFGAVYLGFRLFTSTHVEYEYIVTGNELDIDKIIAQRKRQRLITVKMSKFKSLVRSEEYDASDDDSTVVLAYGADCEDWCAEVEHEKIGNVRLCFSPNRRTLLTMNQYLPARIRLDISESEDE